MNFAVDAMQNRLEVIAFARVLAIEEFHQLKTELLIDVLLGRLGIDFGTDDEPKEELVRDLQVRPCRFQNGLVFFRIEVVRGGRKRSTDIGGNHRHEITHDGFGENLLTGRSIDVIDQFQQRLTLHILATFISRGIIKRKNDTAELQLHNEQLFTLGRRSIPQGRKFLESRTIGARSLNLDTFGAAAALEAFSPSDEFAEWHWRLPSAWHPKEPTWKLPRPEDGECEVGSCHSPDSTSLHSI